MMSLRIMCPCIGETTISPGILLILVRMCHRSTRRMRFASFSVKQGSGVRLRDEVLHVC
jgi:hypothetical protein